jgi:hypothetical protein
MLVNNREFFIYNFGQKAAEDKAAENRDFDKDAAEDEASEDDADGATANFDTLSHLRTSTTALSKWRRKRLQSFLSSTNMHSQHGDQNAGAEKVYKVYLHGSCKPPTMDTIICPHRVLLTLPTAELK